MLLSFGQIPVVAGEEPAPAASFLGDPALRVSATYQRWTYPDLTGGGDAQAAQPLELLLLGDWRNLARRPWRLSLLARVDQDFRGDEGTSGDLLFGYAEALRLGGLFDLWAGRRVPLDGSTLGGLDGVWVDLSGLRWGGAGLHLGKPVAYSDESAAPAWSVGARAWLDGLPWTHLEVRYERREEELLSSGERSRLGGEAIFSWWDDLLLFANVDYELQTSTLERARAGGRYRALGPWRARAEVFAYDPLFDPASVFARMESDGHWGVTGQVERSLGSKASLTGRWTTRVFKRHVLGDSPTADTLDDDPTHAADLGLIVRPRPAITVQGAAGATASEEGAALLASLEGGWVYQPLDLSLRLGGYLNAHDRRFGDPSGILELFGETGSGIQRNLATGAWVDVALAPLPYLSFALRGEGFRDETADQSYRLLARVAGYLF
ncbi:MAG: hypothetical protein RBU45_06755 [Myxococcota bacterium]|nr:hypothetical protein [Myxococcota bacterium]